MKIKIASSYPIALSACALAIFSSVSAHAKPFSEFVEFSGALSDTGNYATTHGDSPAPFYKNRTTNGPVAGELLAARLGFKVESSNHLVGPVQGTNFAVRDALAGGNGPDDLVNEVKAYLDSHGGKVDPDAFFFVFNGGNDVIAAAMNPDDQVSEKLLSDAVKGLENAFRTLISKGAKTIMAPNFVDLSLVPALRGSPAAGRAHKISESYNHQFEQMLVSLEQELKFKFIHWDFDKELKDIIAHGPEFGVTNTTEPCAALVLTGKANPDNYLFLTEIFPTAKAHAMMADDMAIAVLHRDGKHDKENADHYHAESN